MTSESAYSSSAENTAREYYNSDDADNFYYTIWGGEDLHLGIYEAGDEGIFAASRRTVDRMVGRLARLEPGMKLLDVGSGFGGSARHLARTRGCHVTCLNISEKENARNRKMNQEQGLAHLIEVKDGSFEDIPFPDNTFDVVWSQDAILHSGNRDQVVQEIARVVKPGGEVVFTDPMAADDAPAGALTPILSRIHLETLGCPGFYLSAAKEAGLTDQGFVDLTPHLVRHYARVLEESEKNAEALSRVCSSEYVERMKTGLGNWVEGGRKGHLAWGIFLFQK